MWFRKTGQAISEETKVPLIWLFIAGVFLTGIVLFIADIRSITHVNSLRAQNLKETIQTLQIDIKDELAEIRKKLDLMSAESNKCGGI